MNKDIMQSCKEQLRIHIESLVERGERKASIEIELLHWIKRLLYAEEFDS